MEADKTIMFMAHIPIADMSNVVSTLLEYQSVGKYMVSAEETPYQHLHFLVEMDSKDYTRFAKRVFIDKYKLRGQAGRKGTKDEGKPRQYGKVKTIQDIYKASVYTAKEGNLCTNLSDDLVKKIIEESYKKKDKGEKEKVQLYEYMKVNIPDIHCASWEFEKITQSTTSDRTNYAVAEEYYKNYQKYDLPPGYTLGDFGDLRNNLRIYMAKIYDENGPTKNFRVLFLQYCRKLGYLSTYDYVRIVYRI